MSAKRDIVVTGPKAPSLRRQGELIGLNRASWYRRPMEPVPEAAENLTLMHRLDELYTAYPFYGSRKFVTVLRKEGHASRQPQAHPPPDAAGLAGAEAEYEPAASRLPDISVPASQCAD